MKNVTKIQKISINNVATGDNGTAQGTVDLNFKNVIGIKVECNDADSFIGSYFTEASINSEEIFPSGFELKVIQTGVDVSPNERFFKIDPRSDAFIGAGTNYRFGITNSTGSLTSANFNIYLLLSNPAPK